MEGVWYILLVTLAIATMVVGNLFALRQDNIKRFLAFSSIAQVGFILVGMSGNTEASYSAVTYFVLVYVFSNLAAFGVAAVISDESGIENISGYRGLIKSNPFLAWMMALALFSLAGIPPTAGFFGKMFLLSAGASERKFLVHHHCCFEYDRITLLLPESGKGDVYGRAAARCRKDQDRTTGKICVDHLCSWYCFDRGDELDL